MDEGITACQWRTLEEALDVLSYDNARGVLKRAGEMVRTLVAVGAGRPRSRRTDLTAWPPGSRRCWRAAPPSPRSGARSRAAVPDW